MNSGPEAGAERVSAAQWLAGILSVISSASALCFGLLYSVAASYSGAMDQPLVLAIVFSTLAYPVLVVCVVVVAARGFMRTRRFAWGAYLVLLAYSAGVGALLFLASGA